MFKQVEVSLASLSEGQVFWAVMDANGTLGCKSVLLVPWYHRKSLIKFVEDNKEPTKKWFVLY